MKAWERRLKDLAQLLTNCAGTYFDPDLFRMNTNQFLQTARTITFIIQKNKAEISNFEEWYKNNIHKAWDDDIYMQWAKNSRNTIEKEGDLDLNSFLKVTLIFSYLEEDDAHVKIGKTQLLDAGIKKLVRFAQKTLPTAIADAAAIRIERRWVTASLPDSELLYSLAYVYARIEKCCSNLAQHIGYELPKEIPSSERFDDLLEHARDVKYIKLRDGDIVRLRSERIAYDEKFEPSPVMQDALAKIKTAGERADTFHSTMEFLEIMAEATFKNFGNHVPMLFFYDENWKIVANYGTEFIDQADKFLFWRSMAERAYKLKIHGVAWISEAWVKDYLSYPQLPIRKMPIVGEILQITCADRLGNFEKSTWNIIRDTEGKTVVLERMKQDPAKEQVPYYLVPVMRAIGVKDPLVMQQSP